MLKQIHLALPPAAGRRRTVAAELAGRVTFARRSFLLMPGFGQRPVYDDYVIRHRRAAAGRALRRSRKAGRERVSEGGMMRLETFMELKFLNSSLSSSSSR